MEQKKIQIIGVPTDLGAQRRGVDMGPNALRAAGIVMRIKELGLSVSDCGNIAVPFRENVLPGAENKKHGAAIHDLCKELEGSVFSALKEDALPLTIGGDHSFAIGSIAGVSRWYAEQKKKIGLLWIDAHADINTPETTITGNMHGMPLAYVFGVAQDEFTDIVGPAGAVLPSNAVLIGVRDIDPPEQEIMQRIGVKVFGMREIDTLGIAKVMETALAIVCQGTAAIHLSLDIDALDPVHAPGTGTKKTGGLSHREARIIMEYVRTSGLCSSIDIAEVNPALDIKNQTAELACELILSVLSQ